MRFGLLNLCGILVVLFCSCSGNRVKIESIVETMQKNADSCADLYQEAIKEVKAGRPVDIVKAKYSRPIILLHASITSIFDSLTSEYINKKLSQAEYDKIINSLILDTVDRRSQQLSQLGVDIELE